MDIKLAGRMSRFEESATMSISALVSELRSTGKDVIGFSAGEPDFDVPEFVKEATVSAIKAGNNKYTPVAGAMSTRVAVTEYMLREYGLKYEPSEVILSVGAKHSLYNLTQVLLEEGDEVIIFSPYWVTYPDQIKLAGATPVVVQCRAENGFSPVIDELRAAVTSKTKMILMNSPCNPSGAVFSDDAIRGIADVAVKQDILLVSDEIYDKVCYGGIIPLAPATISEEVKQRTVVVNGFSKSHSMTGWRIGFAVGDSKIIKAMIKLQGQSTSNPTTPMQVGSIAGMTDISFIKERVEKFAERRDVIVKRLNKISGISCNQPQGAFYVFPDFSSWIGKSIEGEVITDDFRLTKLLIEKALIAPVPGSAFGAAGFLRFSYALDSKRLEEGMDRLVEFASKVK